MYVYQDRKLYVQSGDKLVWVEIHPDFTFTITDVVVDRKITARNISNSEVLAKFQLVSLEPIEFKPKVTPELPKVSKPQTPKEEVVKTGVIKNEPTKSTKGTSRK
jgi:hypothetical protein